MNLVTVEIPTALRAFAGNKDVVRLEGATVGDLLARLGADYPQLKKHLFDDAGKLRNFVNIYVNDDDIRNLQKEQTPVKEKDVVSIIPAVAGGAAAGSAPGAAGAPPVNGTLNQQQVQRYSRHLILPEVGMEGQRKLRRARVLVIGAGGLGSPTLSYLAAAGIGTIGIVDFDTVDLTNLQRQIIYTTADVGRSKLQVAADRVRAMNPDVEVKLYEARLSSDNAMEILRGWDVVVDGTDNFPTRYLVNDACVMLGIPNVYGSIFRFDGQATVFCTPEGPCYRCVYPEPPPPGLVPSCAEGGVLGVLPGIIGTIQATEAVKLILGKGDSLAGRLLVLDAMRMRFREMKLRKNPDCPVCGAHPTVTSLIDYEQFCGIRGEEMEAKSLGDEWEITPRALHDELAAGRDLVILDVRNPEEAQISRIDGSVLIPLGELPERVAELDTAAQIVVHCRMGGRSAKAVEFLRSVGFRKVRNLVGGINAWADEVDPAMSKY
ncbi:MAG TPA: ubiquitin-like small modifier protein 1 [Spirochaetia bacterium]|nr:ubiquitin-like small modifier protein 1 [Spirochaetia bacterium]